MADHRAEIILAKVLTLCTGLTTTGTNTARTRVYEIDTDGTPALTINMGADNVVEGSDANMAFVDRLLTVEIVAHVKASTTLDTTLNKIAAEVWVAMMANDRNLTLGAFVHTVIPQGASAPEVGVLEKGVAQQTLTYVVYYRHSISDPTA